MKTKQIISAMKVVSWIIFIGICIKAGAIIISSFVSLFVNQEATKDIYLGLDLSSLYDFSLSHYVSVLVVFVLLLCLKAYIFYLVIKLFSNFNISNPFSASVSRLIVRISYVSLIIGLFAVIGNGYSNWMIEKNVSVDIEWGGAGFLFMAGVIFIIGLIFKRGIEIQAENELTI